MTKRPGEKEKPKQPEEITVNLTPGSDPKLGRVYSNFAQVSHNPWEFTVRFCLAPAAPDIKKHIKEDGTTAEIPVIIDVMVPPSLIPALIKALQTNFGKFEKKLEKAMAAAAEPTTH